MSNVKQWTFWLTRKIWFIDASCFPRWRRLGLGLLRRMVLAGECYVERNLGGYAAALTYSTIFAAVPILAIIFAVGRGLGYGSVIEERIRENLSTSQEFAGVVFDFINSYLEHTKSGVFIGFGLLLLLYTVLSLTSSIEGALNVVWGVKRGRSFLKRVTGYISVFLLLPVVIIVSSGVSIFLATAANGLPDFLMLGWGVRVLIGLLPFVFSGLLFSALYVFMPNTEVRFSCAVGPGFVAGGLFQVVQYLYIHSQVWVSSYNAIYGSFAALPLFMLWINISWTICLFGAQLSYANQNVGSYYYLRGMGSVSRRDRDVLFMGVMSRVCKRFGRGMEGYTYKGLSAETGLAEGVVRVLAGELEKMHLLVVERKGEGADERLYPAEDINRLTVGVLLERVDAFGDRWVWNAVLGKGEEWDSLRALRARCAQGDGDVLLKDV